MIMKRLSFILFFALSFLILSYSAYAATVEDLLNYLSSFFKPSITGRVIAPTCGCVNYRCSSGCTNAGSYCSRPGTCLSKTTTTTKPACGCVANRCSAGCTNAGQYCSAAGHCYLTTTRPPTTTTKTLTTTRTTTATIWTTTITTTPPCLTEGQSGAVVPNASRCCSGLTSIGCDRPDSSDVCPTDMCAGAFYCTKCGNGVCGFGENKCNCPQDCNFNISINYQETRSDIPSPWTWRSDWHYYSSLNCSTVTGALKKQLGDANVGDCLYSAGLFVVDFISSNKNTTLVALREASNEITSKGYGISYIDYWTTVYTSTTTTSPPPVTYCNHGTATATNSANYGSYRIYAILGANGAWAKIEIKDSVGNAVNTKVINQGDSWHFSTLDLKVKVVKVKALQDGTVIGADLTFGQIGCIDRIDVYADPITGSTAYYSNGTAESNLNGIRIYNPTSSRQLYIVDSSATFDYGYILFGNQKPNGLYPVMFGYWYPSLGKVLIHTENSYLLSSGESKLFKIGVGEFSSSPLPERTINVHVAAGPDTISYILYLQSAAANGVEVKFRNKTAVWSQTSAPEFKLGNVAANAEADEIVATIDGASQNIGNRSGDVETDIGWIVRNPSVYGATDTFAVSVPVYMVITQTCTDSDGGKSYYTKGTVTKDSESKTDSCDYCTGACIPGKPCPPVVCGAVKEYYCDGDDIASETFVCPSGYTCKDGACAKETVSTTTTTITTSCDKECKNKGYNSGICRRACQAGELDIGVNNSNCPQPMCAPCVTGKPCPPCPSYSCCCSEKELCPYECCEDDSDYLDKSCPQTGVGCVCACPVGGSCPPCECPQPPEYVCKDHACVLKERQKIKFYAGWNLFSIPVKIGYTTTTTTVVQTSEVFKESVTTTTTTVPGGGGGEAIPPERICTYDALASKLLYYSNGKYEEASSIEPGKGYWIKMKYNCVIYVEGEPVTVDDFPGLSNGWNMVGGPAESVKLSDAIGDCNIEKGPWNYNSLAKKYQKAENLKPGEGYWIKVDNACKLGSEVPPPPPSIGSIIGNILGQMVRTGG